MLSENTELIHDRAKVTGLQGVEVLNLAACRETHLVLTCSLHTAKASAYVNIHDVLYAGEV